MKKGITISLILMGAFIGVGFASGKELVTFFARFGEFAIFLALIAGLFFGLIVWLKIKTENSYNKIGKLFDSFFVVCSFIVVSAMLAGIIEINKNFGFKNYILSVILILVCLILVSIGVKSIEKINTVFIPTIIITIILIAVLQIRQNNLNLNKNLITISANANKLQAIGFMLLYVGMNILTISPVLDLVKTKLTTNKEKNVCCVCFGLFIALLLVVCVAMLVVAKNFDSSMPLLAIALNVSVVIGSFYKILITMGLVTTLISSAIVVKEKIMNMFNISNNFIASMLLFIAGFSVGLIGFANIINIIYPLIGIVGIVYFIYTILTYLKMRK